MFLQVCGSRGPQRIVLGYGGGQAESGLDRDSAERIQTEGELGGRAAVFSRNELRKHSLLRTVWVCVVL